MFDIPQEILQGNPRAIAKGISLVENDHQAAQGMMKAIFPYTGKSLVLGITGSPGSGKSTLVDQMVEILREEGKKIGIVAVDPSSPFTGGAILGDRIRMMRHSTDPEIFIRSMATRGHLGGLAKSTGEAITIFEAAGKNVILVETVGVGQDEVEVVKLADLTLVVLIPGAGDDIQAFKAGLMEIADIFVINKSDSPETGKTERQLRAMLDLGFRNENSPPVMKTVATKGTGVKKLVSKIHKITSSRNQDFLESRKKKLIAWMLKDIINEGIYRSVEGRMEPKEFEDCVDKIFKREIDPYTAAEGIIKQIIGSKG